MSTSVTNGSTKSTLLIRSPKTLKLTRYQRSILKHLWPTSKELSEKPEPLMGR